MAKKPVYDMMFEYLLNHYELISLETPLSRFYQKEIYENQLKHLAGPVNLNRTIFQEPQESARVVAEFATAAGADLVGFTHVRDHFVFEGVKIDHTFAVVLAVEMDYDLVATSPEPLAGIEVLRSYWHLGAIACKVAEFIRFLGYPATAHHPRNFIDVHPTILHTVAAIEAGLGESGRHGLLITEEFGPRVRLASVTTELPLPQADRKYFGVNEFCKTCRLCMDACEGDAIPQEKTEVRGFVKYTIDPYKCLPYFGKYDGCNLCVSRCAFNKRPKELEKFIQNLKKEP